MLVVKCSIRWLGERLLWSVERVVFRIRGVGWLVGPDPCSDGWLVGGFESGRKFLIRGGVISLRFVGKHLRRSGVFGSGDPCFSIVRA